MTTNTSPRQHLPSLRRRGGSLLVAGALALGGLGVAACADDDDGDPFTDDPAPNGEFQDDGLDDNMFPEG